MLAMEKTSAVVENLSLQRDELMRPQGSMNYRTCPRLREEILSILFALNDISAVPTKSQLERTLSLEQE